MRARGKPLATAGLSAPELIVKKRDGHALSDDEVHQVIDAFASGDMADYQMSAFAMAVFFRGMTSRETAALTLAMRDSGRILDLSHIPGPKVDKHSTGGVGDKVSICLAPIVAAAGLFVPMVSGRGLGHTGGTLDKLESIPGFRVDLSTRRFATQVAREGCALIGQTSDIAPVDKRLYALRDVTGTVESIPLITASILSKKLSESLDALVLDVKVGTGAFMRTLHDARELARSIVRVGRLAGTPVTAILTSMDQPLGHAVGNALETAEAFEVLHGRGPDDLVELTEVLGAEMLRAAGAARTLGEARRRIRSTIRSGDGLRRMQRIIRAQGGDPRAVEEPDRLPSAPSRLVVPSPRGGYLQRLDGLAIGRAAVRLGAGRLRVDQEVDPAVGIVVHAKVGDRVERGAPLATLHVRSPRAGRQIADSVRSAFQIASRRCEPPSLILETIRR